MIPAIMNLFHFQMNPMQMKIIILYKTLRIWWHNINKNNNNNSKNNNNNHYAKYY